MTATGDATGRPGGAPKMLRMAETVIIYVLLATIAILSLIPFVWLIRSALMEQDQIFKVPPEWWPRPFRWQNFSEALTSVPFGRYFTNTLTIVVLVVPGTLLSCSAAAFSFARLKWPGRNFFFGLLMTGLMLPYAATLVPTFIGWQYLNFINTYIPLTLPAWFGAGGAFSIFMLRQFFISIPHELDNAIYVDGGGPFTVYWKLILPLNKGPLILVAVFTIISVWNDLLNPLIYLSDSSKFTVSLGLASFTGLYSSQWGLLMAAAVVVIAPMLLLFAFAQRHLVQGVALTGLTG